MLAKQLLVGGADEVRWYTEHLQVVSANRSRGARKAAETRSKKAAAAAAKNNSQCNIDAAHPPPVGPGGEAEASVNHDGAAPASQTRTHGERAGTSHSLQTHVTTNTMLGEHSSQGPPPPLSLSLSLSLSLIDCDRCVQCCDWSCVNVSANRSAAGWHGHTSHGGIQLRDCRWSISSMAMCTAKCTPLT
eukprot:jgi/Chlat1/2467/Chrsp171S02347